MLAHVEKCSLFPSIVRFHTDAMRCDGRSSFDSFFLSHFLRYTASSLTLKIYLPFQEIFTLST